MSRHSPRLLVLLAAGWAATIVAAGEPAPLRAASPVSSALPDSSAQLHQLITGIAREHIPHSFEDWSKWGTTSERWDGVKMSVDGLRLKTQRRKKEFNHGDWQMYRVELINPDEDLQIRVESTRDAGDGRVAFDVLFTARLHCFGRYSKWVKGVQLVSLSADANAKVTLRVGCELGLRLDVTKFPPDVILAPHVSDADLRLDEFKVYRVSDVGGEAAQQLGRGIRKIVVDKIEQSEAKLPEKLNRQIEKKQDRLRLSLRDLMASQWRDLAKYVQKDDPAKN